MPVPALITLTPSTPPPGLPGQTGTVRNVSCPVWWPDRYSTTLAVTGCAQRASASATVRPTCAVARGWSVISGPFAEPGTRAPTRWPLLSTAATPGTPWTVHGRRPTLVISASSPAPPANPSPMLDAQTNAPPGSAGWAIPHRGATDDAAVARLAAAMAPGRLPTAVIVMTLPVVVPIGAM